MRERRAHGEDAAEHEGLAVKPATALLAILTVVVGMLVALVLARQSTSSPLDAYASSRDYPEDVPRGTKPDPVPFSGVRTVEPGIRPVDERVRPTDTTIDVVPSMDSVFHFAAFPPDAPRHVRGAAGVSTAIAIVRIENITGRLADPDHRRVESTVTATVLAVLKDVSGQRLRRGGRVSYRQSGVGEMRLGHVRLITRMPWDRVPLRGRRYLTFFWQCRDETLLEVGDSTLEITGSSVVPMLHPNPWAGGPVPLKAVVDEIHRLGRVLPHGAPCGPQQYRAALP